MEAAFSILRSDLAPFLVLAFIFAVVATLVQSRKRGVANFPYQAAGALMSQAEASFLRVLELVLPADKYRIFGKVRVEDIISVKPGLDRSQRARFRNSIKSRHVDFVVVDRESFQPVWLIELDDKSHQRANRARRDRFLDAAFESAGLKLHHFSAKRAYKPQELSEALAQATYSDADDVARDVPDPVDEVKIAPPPVSHMEAEQQSLCPKCYAPMRKRKVKSGRFQGTLILACSRYPACRQFVPLAKASELPRKVVPSAFHGDASNHHIDAHDSH